MKLFIIFSLLFVSSLAFASTMFKCDLTVYDTKGNLLSDTPLAPDKFSTAGSNIDICPPTIIVSISSTSTKRVFWLESSQQIGSPQSGSCQYMDVNKERNQTGWTKTQSVSCTKEVK